MSEFQLKAMGKNTLKEVYWGKLDELYQKPNERFIGEEDMIQTFDEFVEMGKYEPDKHANGKNLVKSDTRTIAIITLGAITNERSIISSLISHLSAYFCLDFTQLPPLDQCKISKSWSIINETQKCYCILRFYVLADYCILSLTSSPLYGPEQPSNFILGRGCGNRVYAV